MYRTESERIGIRGERMSEYYCGGCKEKCYCPERVNNRNVRESTELTGSMPCLPACSRADLIKYINTAWGELRRDNTSIPDDVLDYIRETALYCTDKA